MGVYPESRYIYRANAVWSVFSSGMSDEETPAMGSLQGDNPQGVTWFCLPKNNKILIAFIL